MRRKEEKEVTDVGRARRRHLRRIRMRGRVGRERYGAGGRNVMGGHSCSLWIIDQPRKGSKNICAVERRKSKRTSIGAKVKREKVC